MANTEIKHRPTFREIYLNPVLSDGSIERIYPDLPKHPKQKYRLTEAAKEWEMIQFGLVRAIYMPD